MRVKKTSKVKLETTSYHVYYRLEKIKSTVYIFNNYLAHITITLTRYNGWRFVCSFIFFLFLSHSLCLFRYRCLYFHSLYLAHYTFVLSISLAPPYVNHFNRSGELPGGVVEVERGQIVPWDSFTPLTR